MGDTLSLTEALDMLKRDTRGQKISFGDIVETLNHRGFGALIIAPALITVLPTGAIPGIPALCAIFIILIAAQLVFGRSHPWIPKRLDKMSFSRKKYEQAVEKARPYTQWIDRFFHPRLQFLTRKVAQRIIAVICVLLSLIIIVVGFIPFIPMLPALAILMFGLGISVHDGLLIAFGFIAMGIAFAVIPFLF